MYAGAFDIGGTKTIIALSDENGNLLGKKQFPTETGDCPAHLKVCCGVFREILQTAQVEAGQVEGIGVNLPGLTDTENGVLLRAVYAGWNNVPVKAILKEELGINNILCENDVNSCAMGELLFGLGKEYRNFGWMTVSTGVGGAVVCGGQLIRGAHGYAGEFGHIKVEYEEPALCPCGEKGCLEAHGSGTAISRMIEEALQTVPGFAEAFEQIGEQPSGASCAKLARSGNETAAGIFEQAGRYLGRGIATYVNILDPEAVIIGGGVSASLDLLMPGIREEMDKCAFAQMKDVKILPTALGYEAALMGAIALVVLKRERM